MIEALILAYESCKDRFDEPVTFDDFLILTKEWECLPIYVARECAGAIMSKGNEFHVCIIEKFHKRWASKSLYKHIYTDKLQQYGEIFTSVSANNEIGKRFVERCGFRVYDTNANVVIYRLGG